ncbi:unnamed protein product [Acidithrix sp. C25]|nr:unnamed protein product [Acidithrix sp. C25]
MEPPWLANLGTKTYSSTISIREIAQIMANIAICKIARSAKP